MKDIYVQVGVTSMRTPTGAFLPSIPIYIKANKQSLNNNMLPQEEKMLSKIAATIVTTKMINKGVI